MTEQHSTCLRQCKMTMPVIYVHIFDMMRSYLEKKHLKVDIQFEINPLPFPITKTVYNRKNSCILSINANDILCHFYFRHIVQGTWTALVILLSTPGEALPFEKGTKKFYVRNRLMSLAMVRIYFDFDTLIWLVSFCVDKYIYLSWFHESKVYWTL